MIVIDIFVYIRYVEKVIVTLAQAIRNHPKFHQKNCFISKYDKRKCYTKHDMQRGIIKLTQDEILYLKEFLAQNHSDKINIFLEKINNLSHNNSDFAEIQTNEDDLEIILDLLPAPSENQALVSLRKNLSMKLLELRQ